ncbi:MAG: glutaredoxin domain-containing protein [Bacteroidota bacterium]|nr:glutaredoxin domain-containing protein [Bacteroidota bacterium]
MKEINSHKELLDNIKSIDRSFLLLYKKGSEQSECSIKNINEAIKENSDVKLFTADVSKVRDIHGEYNVKTAPSLLEFEKENFKNISKGCNNPKFYNSIFENIYFTQTEGEEKPQKRVTVYSTPTCTYCGTLKSYLRKNKIRFTDIDVSKDQNAAKDMVNRSGQQGVPQTDINGQIIVGFDKSKINTLLEINA